MSKYKIREGIVLQEIHGVYLLCADKDARRECRFVREINSTGAIVWTLLSKGYDIEPIVEYLSDRYAVPSKTTLRCQVEEYLNILMKENYIYYQ